MSLTSGGKNNKIFLYADTNFYLYTFKIRLILLTVMETTSPFLRRRTPCCLAGCRATDSYTVVCCHCTDPFNFYPGTAPNIEDIKFWGLSMGRCASVRTSFCDDNGSFVASCAWGCIRIL